MRTKFTVSIAAAGAVLAGVAVPMIASDTAYTSQAQTAERQLIAANLGTKRPLLAANLGTKRPLLAANLGTKRPLIVESDEHNENVSG
jgi:hypothetical protein